MKLFQNSNIVYIVKIMIKIPSAIRENENSIFTTFTLILKLC